MVASASPFRALIDEMLILYTGTFVTLLVLYYYVSRRSSDPYGTFHLSFNKVPGSPNPPRTEWLNMGFWKVRQSTTVTFEQLIHSRVGHHSLPRSVSR